MSWKRHLEGTSSVPTRNVCFLFPLFFFLPSPSDGAKYPATSSAYVATLLASRLRCPFVTRLCYTHSTSSLRRTAVILPSGAEKHQGCKKRSSAPSRQLSVKLKEDAITQALGNRNLKRHNMPPEMKHLIASFLAFSDLKSYSQPSRESHGVASRLLFRKLKIQKPGIEMTNIIEALTPYKIPWTSASTSSTSLTPFSYVTLANIP